MSIVNSETVSSIVDGDNLDVRFKYTDHIGDVFYKNDYVPVGTDLDALRLSKIPQIESMLSNREIEEAILAGETDGMIVDRVPDHQTQPDFDRRVIGVAMTISDIIHFYNIYDTFFRAFESRAGNNKPQRAAYLGTDTATYDEIDKRFNDMAGITILITDEKGRVWDEVPEGFK